MIAKPLRSFQLDCRGNNTSLSDFGKYIPWEYEIDDGDFITVTHRQETSTEERSPLKTFNDENKIEPHRSTCKKNGKSKRKGKKVARPAPLKKTKEEAEDKIHKTNICI